MPMVQCENRHMYDNRKHVYCPYCPVPGLKNPRVEKTQAASMEPPHGGGSGGGSTEAAFPPRGFDQPRPAASPNRGGVANVTVGVFQRHAAGVNPVTGWIVCIQGVNTGRDYRLHSDRNMLGRAANMDVCIEGDETISREDHCQIAFSPRSKTFTLIPGTGRNLIYLNGTDVFQATPLKAYDRIDLGESGFLFIPFCGNDFMWARTDPPDAGPPSAPQQGGGPAPRKPGGGTVVG
jgi:hypothetical protein